MFDLPAFVEFLRSFDTSCEEEILLSLYTRRRPEEKSDLIFSEIINIPIDSIMCLPRDNNPWYHEYTSEK